MNHSMVALWVGAMTALVAACTVESSDNDAEPCEVPGPSSSSSSSSSSSGGSSSSSGASTDAGDAGAEVAPNSRFDVDADGWTIVGDAAEAQPRWEAEGGNPGGLISADDNVTGGTWYFKAPQKFLGDRSAAYGKDLAFELRIDAPPTELLEGLDVVLEGAGLTLVFDTTPVPGTAWTAYALPLTEAAGWKKNTYAGEAPTADEFRAVLANATGLRIRGEFNVGPDTGALDNPVFGAEP